AKRTECRAAPAEREAPSCFQTPVDIAFTMAKGVVTKRVTITERDQVFFFSLPEKPRDVEFDPGNWIPTDRDFDKPKTMLLFQLQGDKNMVGRARAAQRLSKYTT